MSIFSEGQPQRSTFPLLNPKSSGQPNVPYKCATLLMDSAAMADFSKANNPSPITYYMHRLLARVRALPKVNELEKNRRWRWENEVS
uniref:Uncharacterized protein n=1 Tax=Anguilla anguilla TaxID=7936 RepID=A0A0E9Q058_ANGAN